MGSKKKPSLRVMPPPRPDLEAFVHGKAPEVGVQSPAPEVQASTPEVQAPAPAAVPSKPEIRSPVAAPPPIVAVRGTARGTVRRADGRELGRVTVYVDQESNAKLKRYCFTHGVTASDLCAPAVLAFIESLPE
jgi:hypothetical protein